jgi:hypothetical protein
MENELLDAVRARPKYLPIPSVVGDAATGVENTTENERSFPGCASNPDQLQLASNTFPVERHIL